MILSRSNLLPRTDLCAIKISGKDRLDFLNRLSSQKVISATPGDVLPAAFLNANGTPKSICHLWFCDNHVILITKKVLEPATLKLIDDFHFGEDIQVAKASEFKFAELRQNQFSFGSLQKAKTVNGYTLLPLESWKSRNDQLEIQRCYVVFEKIAGDMAQSFGAILLTAEQAYEQRVRMGISEFPEEMSDSNIILESDFDSYVHRNKGCYPGQEVVERIFTYGNVAKKIVPFELKGLVTNAQSLKGIEVLSEGTSVGSVLSAGKAGDRVVGLCIVKRLPLEKKQTFEVNGSGERHSIDIIY